MMQDTTPALALLEKLRIVAAHRQTIFYSEIADIARLSVDNPFFDVLIGEKLDAVNHYEHAQGRPLLSAVVISKEHNRPGIGFFSCAQTLGLFSESNRDDF